MYYAPTSSVVGSCYSRLRRTLFILGGIIPVVLGDSVQSSESFPRYWICKGLTKWELVELAR